MAYEDKYAPEVRRAFRKEFWKKDEQRHKREIAKRLAKMNAPDAIEVAGVPIHDWKILGELCARNAVRWSNIDSIDTILREARSDARYLKPDWITKDHLRVAAHLTMIGRTVSGSRHDQRK